MDKKFKEWHQKEFIEGSRHLRHMLPQGWDNDISILLEHAYRLGKESRKKKKNPDPVFGDCVEVWLKKIHPGWSFRPADGNALNGILSQMRAYSLKNNEVEPSNEKVLQFFEHLTTHLPAFYKNQTLSVINSKFDPIVDEIRTGSNTNRKQTARDIINSL